jgi:arylformamidase
MTEKVGRDMEAAKHVYGKLTQEQLDRSYDARATVGGDIDGVLQVYRNLTTRARATLLCRIGLPYGPTEPECVDVFPASGAAPAPVFIYLHGGYWRLLDAADSAFMAETFTTAGVCVVVVNYALAPSVRLAEIVRQCRSAVAWVHHNIAAFGGDPDRIHVSGSSAGAHLAGMVLAGGWQNSLGLPLNIVKSASLFSGLFDLEPVRLSYVNSWARLDADEALAMSPIHWRPSSREGILFAYAPSDTDEFKRQSEHYKCVCVTAGCEVALMEVPGTNHFDIVLQLCDPTAPVTQNVFDLIWGK